MEKDQFDLSIIVPAYNEEGSVVELHQEILEVCQKLNRSFEIIFINDGSTDATLEKLKRLIPIKIINFRKNFGQTSALDAGIKLSRGHYIVALDADGQNDPHDIPMMIAYLEDNSLDAVSGWRFNRQDKRSKKIASILAAWLRKRLINDGIHDSGCTLKVYQRRCFNGIDLTGEMHRFIPALLKIKGYRIGEVRVSHRFRTTGITKYNWKRGLKGGLDILSVWFWKKYANRPLHLFGGGGVLFILISLISGVIVTWRKVFLDLDLSDTILSELTIYLFLIGIQFVIFGLLSDFLSKIYYSITKDNYYSVDNLIVNDSDNENNS